MKIQAQPNVWQGLPGFYQVKNENFEEMSWGMLPGWDRPYIIRMRDSSDYAENTFYSQFSNCEDPRSTSCMLGAQWAPRYMGMYEEYERINTYVRVSDRLDCHFVTQYRAVTKIKLEDWFPVKTINGYDLQDVIYLQSYRREPPDTGPYVPWEQYYYQRNVGLVQFIDLSNGFHSVYDGEEPRDPFPQLVDLCYPQPPPSVDKPSGE